MRFGLLFAFSLLLLISRPAQAEEALYTVQPGDTLSEIAKAHGTNVNALRALNGLGNVDLVWVGQRLRLPDTAPTDEVAADEVATTETVTDEADEAAATAATTAAQSADAEEVALAQADADSSAPVAATATPTPVPPTASLPETVVALNEKSDIYIAEAGDTLSQIAVRYRTTLAHLIEFNQISPAQRLKPGQAIVVPIAGSAVAALDAVEPTVHIVQRGEALSTIANAHNVTVAALAQANGIGNTGLIVPGQQLFIPTGNQDGLGAMPLGSDGYHVHTKFPTATEKWIDVDLSEQRLVAYRGHKPIRSFIISSGLPRTPTVTGTFRIWAKTPMQDMYAGNRAAGYSYYLEDVQWVQYFYKDYGIHGAYWHNNFGQPMSHGCINMRNEDAKWLFEWASPTVEASHGWFISDEENQGTLVVVHD